MSSDEKAKQYKTGLWSESEVAYLYANYKNQNSNELAANLCRTYTSVVQKLYKHRLSTTGRQLKSNPINKKIQVKAVWSNLPIFHPVMIGILPVALTKGGSNSKWRQRRHIILKMHDYCCAYCGDEADTVDHVIPINKGGIDDPLNLVACCRRCNFAFGDRTKHLRFNIEPVQKDMPCG